MNISAVINRLESWAPLAYQESYDNAGLICGNPEAACTGVLCSLDCTEEVVQEAVRKGCNLVVAHHPIVFAGLKKITPHSYVGRAITAAILNGVNIYAIHTNLDNIEGGVSFKMAEKLGLEPSTVKVLEPKNSQLYMLYTYVPTPQAKLVYEALFAAGAGHIGRYAECAFALEGTGSFRPLEGTNPTIGNAGGPREYVNETKLEVIFPKHLYQRVINALHKAHPYETVAYQVVKIENNWEQVGSGAVGHLPTPMSQPDFLNWLCQTFKLPVVKHTLGRQKIISKVALCGGTGFFLLRKAIAAGADAFITSDLKYHEYFEADGQLLLADIGHFESEQYTIELLQTFLQANFPTFAVLKAEVGTNPVHYFLPG